MRIAVLSIGRLKAGPEKALVGRYQERAAPLCRSLGFGVVDALELPESNARNAEQRKSEEGKALLARCLVGVTIVFDECGSNLSSNELAKRFAGWRDAGAGNVNLIIGGPDGLDSCIRDKATLMLSFGAMTIPHQIVRALVFEQIYRCLTILAGHPYHRI